MAKNSPWYVYLVLCCDNTYYCGMAKDVTRRIFEHNYTTRGAKYTRGRRNVILAFKEEVPTRSKALKREAEIKKMSKAKKRELVEAWNWGRTP